MWFGETTLLPRPWSLANERSSISISAVSTDAIAPWVNGEGAPCNEGEATVAILIRPCWFAWDRHLSGSASNHSLWLVVWQQLRAQ